MKPALSACTGDRCISRKACEQSGPLPGSKKLHTMGHLKKLSPAGIIWLLSVGKGKWLPALPTHVFCTPFLIYFPVSYKSLNNCQK